MQAYTLLAVNMHHGVTCHTVTLHMPYHAATLVVRELVVGNSKGLMTMCKDTVQSQLLQCCLTAYNAAITVVSSTENIPHDLKL